jgi:predicted PurR-regulated permease PerM
MTTRISSADFCRYVILAVGIIVLVLFTWKVIDVILLAFGGVVFAAVLRALTNLCTKRLKLPEKLSLTLVIILLLAGVGALVWLFGDQLLQQAAELQRQWPHAVEAAQRRVNEWGGGKFLTSTLRTAAEGSSMVGNAAKFAGKAAGFVGYAVVMLFVGIYFAISPDTYVRGLVRLFPTNRRQTARDAFHASGVALRKWLIGQLAAMTMVGVCTGIGLAIAGVPLPLALGVLAGLLDFVPVIGPVIAAIPGIILATSVDPRTAIYAIIVYFAVQQVENHVIVPLTQRWSVSLPPAMAVLSIVMMGIAFGLLGALLAMPITVVAMILIQRLYVEEGLEGKKNSKTGMEPEKSV